MTYYVKLQSPSRKRRFLTPRKRQIYHKEPTLSQIAQREKVVQIAKWYRGQPPEKLLAKLAEFGYYATEKRIYQGGGVGSWRWLPKFAVFRIQVRASHCSNKGLFTPYALCVEV